MSENKIITELTPEQEALIPVVREKGCVAKTGVSLVEVAKVPTVARPTHSVHEPKAPIQVALLPIRHYPIVCAVVSALS